MIQMRYYQGESIDATFDFFREHKVGNPLIELPTGTGKSVVIAGICERAIKTYPGTRIVVATHSKHLVEQNAQKLLDIWPEAPVGVYSAGLGRKENHKAITFAGIDSVASKPHIFGKQNLFINDEAHLFDWKKDTRYHKFVTGLQKINPRVKGIGLSATPWRQGVGHITMGGYWTHTAYSKIGIDDFHEFVENGFLAPLYPLRTDLVLDVKGVSTSAGDYAQGELERAVNKEDITRAAIAESLGLAAGRKRWLVFCSGVQHVEDTVRLLKEAGIGAVGVHSKQPDKVNDLNVEFFKNGHVQALVNMGVLTTGFDCPEIDYIMMLRPTQSAVLWVQMLGRGTRPAPWAGKTDCLVGDFAGNAKRLGPINDPVIPRPKGKGKGVAPIKTCEACGCENHTSARVCIRCGSNFPEAKPKIKEYADNTALMKESEDAEPLVEIIKVDDLSYGLHRKVGKPDSLKVTYTCGMRMFTDYVCLGHEGFARTKAKRWWAARLPRDNPPATALEAMDFVDMLPRTTHIRVWVNKPYPEIMDWCIDGTAFGTIEPFSDDFVPEKVDEETARALAEFDGVEYVAPVEDDIPF